MWQRIASSDAAINGTVTEGVLTGGDTDIDVVVWRTLDGRPVVMDARCPHQWSHLGAEGFVDGDEIVCTAHFWRFSASGRGTKLNVNGRRDEKADIDVFPCEERDGAIWARRAPQLPDAGQ
jgi:phenylpropionate dioxygenase-like ring-hydroxylating dioxygenase large terminal subunit